MSSDDPDHDPGHRPAGQPDGWAALTFGQQDAMVRLAVGDGRIRRSEDSEWWFTRAADATAAVRLNLAWPEGVIIGYSAFDTVQRLQRLGYVGRDHELDKAGSPICYLADSRHLTQAGRELVDLDESEGMPGRNPANPFMHWFALALDQREALLRMDQGDGRIRRRWDERWVTLTGVSEPGLFGPQEKALWGDQPFSAVRALERRGYLARDHDHEDWEDPRHLTELGHRAVWAGQRVTFGQPYRRLLAAVFDWRRVLGVPPPAQLSEAIREERQRVRESRRKELEHVRWMESLSESFRRLVRLELDHRMYRVANSLETGLSLLPLDETSISDTWLEAPGMPLGRSDAVTLPEALAGIPSGWAGIVSVLYALCGSFQPIVGRRIKVMRVRRTWWGHLEIRLASAPSEFLRAAITDLEQIADQTCETCGATGQPDASRRIACTDHGPASSAPDARSVASALLRFATLTDPFAFLLAIIFDQGINRARAAWAAPYLLRQRLGHLDPALMAAAPQRIEAAIQQPPQLLYFVTKTPAWVHAAAVRVLRDYGGDAGRIWADCPPAATLRSRLEAFDGIGGSKAAMAIEILARDLRVPVADLHGIDIDYDVHMRLLGAGLAVHDDLPRDGGIGR
jgi:hypothetical protein